MTRRDELAKLLQDLKPEVDFAGSDDFIGEGLLDSYDIVTIVTELEEKFGVDVPGEKVRAENFRNLDVITNEFLSDE